MREGSAALRADARPSLERVPSGLVRDFNDCLKEARSLALRFPANSALRQRYDALSQSHDRAVLLDVIERGPRLSVEFVRRIQAETRVIRTWVSQAQAELNKIPEIADVTADLVPLDEDDQITLDDIPVIAPPDAGTTKTTTVSPAAPEPVAPVKTLTAAEYADQQGIRQRFQALVAEHRQVREELNSWRSMFRRQALEDRQRRLNRDMKVYREKYPYVLEHPVAPPTKPVVESVPVATAPATDRARLRELNRPVYVEALKLLNGLLANPPSRNQNYDLWYRDCINKEASLAAYGSLGVSEQNQTATYWRNKVRVLEQIKPVFFGRARWQQEYNRATTESQVAVGHSLKRQLSE